jgi:hypothetical protein
MAVSERRDGAVAIGAQQMDARLGIALDCTLRRMTEGIRFAGGNNRYFRSDSSDEIGSG